MFSRYIVQLIPSMDAESGGPVNVLRSLKNIMDQLSIDNSYIETNERRFPSISNPFYSNGNIYFSHCIWDIYSYLYFIFSNRIFIFSHGMLDRKAFDNKKLKKKIFSKLFFYFIDFRKVTIIFGSREELDQAIFKPKRSIIVPNPVCLGDNLNSSKQKTKRTGKTKFVYFSRFDPRKGLSELIAAFNSVSPSNSELHILGLKSDLAYEDRIRRMLKNSSNIFMHENYTGIDARNLMRSCDIICLWSEFEGQPMSVLEGVSDGLLPLVSSNCNLPFQTMSYFGLERYNSKTDLPILIEYFSSFDRTSLERLRTDYLAAINLRSSVNQKVESFLSAL